MYGFRRRAVGKRKAEPGAQLGRIDLVDVREQDLQRVYFDIDDAKIFFRRVQKICGLNLAELENAEKNILHAIIPRAAVPRFRLCAGENKLHGIGLVHCAASCLSPVY